MLTRRLKRLDHAQKLQRKMQPQDSSVELRKNSERQADFVLFGTPWIGEARLALWKEGQPHQRVWELRWLAFKVSNPTPCRTCLIGGQHWIFAQTEFQGGFPTSKGKNGLQQWVLAQQKCASELTPSHRLSLANAIWGSVYLQFSG